MITLRDAVLGVRSALGELQPRLFNDIDIVRDINVACRAFTSEAQALTNTYASITLAPPTAANPTTSNQEYQLPEDCEQPLRLKVQIGVLFPVTIAPQKDLQVGASVFSVPLTAYFRRGTLISGQIALNSGSVSSELVYPMPSQVLGRPQIGQWIVGFYPMPAAAYPFFLDYIAYHPQLTQPLDPILIPEMYFNELIGYAVAQGKKKEGDVQSYQLYLSDFRQGVQKYKEYIERLSVQATPPQWGNEGNPWFNNGPAVTILAPINPTIEQP